MHPVQFVVEAEVFGNSIRSLAKISRWVGESFRRHIRGRDLVRGKEKLYSVAEQQSEEEGRFLTSTVPYQYLQIRASELLAEKSGIRYLSQDDCGYVSIQQSNSDLLRWMELSTQDYIVLIIGPSEHGFSRIELVTIGQSIERFHFCVYPQRKKKKKKS